MKHLQLLLPLAAITALPCTSLAREHTALRGGSGVEDDENSGGHGGQNPKLTDCLLSASDSDGCGTVVAGCVWCAEPVYGLCVTRTAAERMKVMPFFTCSLDLAS